jgi:hypothetical protein
MPSSNEWLLVELCHAPDHDALRLWRPAACAYQCAYGMGYAWALLGGVKHLFDGFSGSLSLEHRGVRPSHYATFIDCYVKRPAQSA